MVEFKIEVGDLVDIHSSYGGLLTRKTHETADRYCNVIESGMSEITDMKV